MTNSPGINWAVYETNVQQYRVLSATVQSFLLTIGSILFTAQPAVPGSLLMFVFAVGIVHAIYVWPSVVFARIKVVDYYKFQHDLRLSDEVRGQLSKECDEKQYVNDRVLRELVNRKYFNSKVKSVWRLTRVKLDLFVPGTYALVWLGLLLWKRPWQLALWA